MPPLRGLVFGGDTFYTDVVPTELKRGLKSSRFPRRIRFGCKPNLPDLGTQAVIFSKIDTYGAVSQPHLPFWGRVVYGDPTERAYYLVLSAPHVVVNLPAMSTVRMSLAFMTVSTSSAVNARSYTANSSSKPL